MRFNKLNEQTALIQQCVSLKFNKCVALRTQLWLQLWLKDVIGSFYFWAQVCVLQLSVTDNLSGVHDWFLTRAAWKHTQIPANDTKVIFSIFSRFSAPRLLVCFDGSGTKAAVFLLTKLFILFLSVENNKTLNPGRAQEPYAPRWLSAKSGFSSFKPKALRFGGSSLLAHYGWIV